MGMICVSGGFDPIHIGHVKMILEAKKLHPECRLGVILNSDAWIMRKKGYIFMPWGERASIVNAIKGVDDVYEANDSDGTVCKSLDAIRPKYFANGGDRTNDNTPEIELCKKLGIEMLWGVGGGKIQSSSELVKNANKIR